MRRFLLLTIALFFSFCEKNSIADTYQVEVVIFQNLSLDASSKQSWPQTFSGPNLSNAIELTRLSSSESSSSLYQILPKQDFLLANTANTIARTQDYRLITHLAWQQNLTNTRTAKPVHIFGGRAYDSNGNIIDYPSVTPPQDPNRVPAGTMVAQVLPDNWEINGTVTASKLGKIQFGVNLIFTLPTQTLPPNINNNIKQPLMSFQLQQQVTLKNGALQYLDNPLFGMLVIVKAI